MDSTPLYVRIEGVNLDNFVYDVHDLSTIRGGSFLLLDAVRRVRDEFPKSVPVAFEDVSTGASSGLFRCTGWAGRPEELRDGIERFLAEDSELRHATLVVDVAADADFLNARESLLAMNRWRQFQQPTVAVPSEVSTIQNRECNFDHLRPATEWIPQTDGDSRPASTSVKVRRDAGRSEKRRDFYVRELALAAESTEGSTKDAIERLLGDVKRASFVTDLETLASDPKGSLDAKIAILYFDGNGFGKIQKDCDETTLPRFDRLIKSYRRAALQQLLTTIFAEPAGWFHDKQVRLETLLWGGDELIWVVPAWKGWAVADLFYDTSRHWNFDGKPLTHAGGIVFCHRSTHIHRMTKLAKELAESCKTQFDETVASSHEARDLFAYQVLESFDVIGTDFDDFRSKRVARGHPAKELSVSGWRLGEIAKLFAVVRDRFPRSKLHDIVKALRHDDEPVPTDAKSLTTGVKAIITRVVESLDDETSKALKDLFGEFVPSVRSSGEPWFDEKGQTAWFHIAELWDYLPVNASTVDRNRGPV